MFSLALHLAFFIAATKLHLFVGQHLAEESVYYVDVVTLPVANPQSGSPVEAAAPASPSPLPAADEAMKAPKPSAAKSPAKPAASVEANKNSQRNEQANPNQEFQERLSRLEQEVESRHKAAALDALRKKASGSNKGPVGMPGGKGTEAGSSYASYIQSRLIDAFKSTIAYQSKNPSVQIRLTIDRAGRITGYRIERSSGDKLFEDAVSLAVNKAGKNFPPPPGGGDFEQGFIFRPQGVNTN